MGHRNAQFVIEINSAVIISHTLKTNLINSLHHPQMSHYTVTDPYWHVSVYVRERVFTCAVDNWEFGQCAYTVRQSDGWFSTVETN